MLKLNCPVLLVWCGFWIGTPYVLRDQVDWVRKSKGVWSAGALAGVVYGGLLAGFALMR